MNSKELIIDTGFFLALLSRNDQFHEQAKKLKTKIDKRKWVTTWPVLTEVCHLLVKRGAENSIRPLLEVYQNGGYNVFSLTHTHTSRLLDILQKYQDLPIDLADASLVILAEELGHGDIVSTDKRDFHAYRWKEHNPFNNLFHL